MSRKDELPEAARESAVPERAPLTCEVDKGMMMKLPWAVDDPNPLWRDERYARQTRHGGLIASPYLMEFLRFRASSSYTGPTAPVAPRPAQSGGSAGVAGGSEVEFIRPIRPGDIITIEQRPGDVKKRFSKSLQREIVIETSEQVFTNQLGEVVATYKSTGIRV